MATTKIHESCAAFEQRADKSENGVSAAFAEAHPDWEAQNETNEGCWDCHGCTGCAGCADCAGCSLCTACRTCGGCSRCEDCLLCEKCTRCTGCDHVAHRDDHRLHRDAVRRFFNNNKSTGGKRGNG